MRVRALAAILLAGALAGCGNSGGGGGGGGGGEASSATIAQAAAKTARAGSVKADFTISGAGAKGSGSGVFNTGADRSGRLTMNLAVNNHRSAVDTIVTGDVLYMRSRVFAQAGLSGADQWVKLDLAALAQQRGIDLSSLVNASPTPATAFAYLRGVKDVKKVGSEPVAGVDTTHYRATVDLAAAAANADRAEAASIRRVMRTSGRKTLPIDVWIDGQGYVRKLRWAEHTTGGAAATVTMVLHDFSGPVTIKPPSGKVLDLLQRLTGGGG